MKEWNVIEIAAWFQREWGTSEQDSSTELPQDLTLRCSVKRLFSGPLQLSCRASTSTKPQSGSSAAGIKPSRSLGTLTSCISKGLWVMLLFPTLWDNPVFVFVLSRPSESCHGNLKGSYLDMVGIVKCKLAANCTVNYNTRFTNAQMSPPRSLFSASLGMYYLIHFLIMCFHLIFCSGQRFLLTTGFLAVFYFWIKIAYFLRILFQQYYQTPNVSKCKKRTHKPSETMCIFITLSGK